MKTDLLVIGCGNTLRSDDGVGPRVRQNVSRRHRAMSPEIPACSPGHRANSPAHRVLFPGNYPVPPHIWRVPPGQLLSEKTANFGSLKDSGVSTSGSISPNGVWSIAQTTASSGYSAPQQEHFFIGISEFAIAIDNLLLAKLFVHRNLLLNFSCPFPPSFTSA